MWPRAGETPSAGTKFQFDIPLELPSESSVLGGAAVAVAERLMSCQWVESAYGQTLHLTKCEILYTLKPD